MRGSHAAIALSLSVVSASPVAATPTECPDGFAANADRERDVLDQLTHAEHGQALARDLARTTRVCFGATDVSVASTDTLLLDARAGDRALAARTAHLAAHLARPSRFDPATRGDIDCARWVSDVLHAEAEAFAIELDVARDLGVTTPYAFADAPAGERAVARIDRIAAFLRAHPDGSAGIEPLASAYEERCRASGHE